MKNNDSFRIAGACAFGALIGSLVALELSAQFTYGSYLWIIGALVGGIAAYIAIDFQHFCEGVSESFRRTIAWRPHGLYWRAFGSVFLYGAAIVPTIVTALTVLFWFVSSFDGSLFKYTMMDVMMYSTVFIAAFSALIIPAVAIPTGLLEISRHEEESEEAWVNRLGRVIKSNKDIARKCNLFSTGIAIVYLAWRFVRYCFTHAHAAAAATAAVVKTIGKKIGLFMVTTSIYVHSTRRTICFVDAAIGAVIGYYSGSAIVGSVAGAILGVINYEVVSVRWLRLVPASR